MPAQVQLQTIDVLFEGLQQKQDRRSTIPGRLERCDNVEFDKTGALNKARGYMRVEVAGTAFAGTGFTTTVEVEPTLMRLATFRDELVVFGMERMYALASREVDIIDNGLVFRGPTFRGAARILPVHVAAISERDGL